MFFQGTEFENLADTVLEDRFERLIGLVTWLSEDGDLPIAMALANVVQSEQLVFTNIFDFIIIQQEQNDGPVLRT